MSLVSNQSILISGQLSTLTLGTLCWISRCLASRRQYARYPSSHGAKGLTLSSHRYRINPGQSQLMVT
ncbi:hypothetical protein BDV10DRAFT_166816 [Aspergillus recurvatus]